MTEMNLDALVDQLTELSPILQVPGASVDLVNDDAIGIPRSKIFQHQGEYASSSFCRRLPLFKPLRDVQAAAFSEANNRIFLLLERYTTFPLLGG